MHHMANYPVTQARNLESLLILTDSHKHHLHNIHTHTQPKHTHTNHTHAFSLTHICTHVYCIHMLHSCTQMCTYMLSLLHTHMYTCIHTHTHINPICKGQVLSILPLYPPYLSNPATMALELRPSSLLTWLLGDLPECSPSFLWTQAPHQSQRYISKWKSSIVLPSCTLPHLLLSVA